MAAVDRFKSRSPTTNRMDVSHLAKKNENKIKWKGEKSSKSGT